MSWPNILIRCSRRLLSEQSPNWVIDSEWLIAERMYYSATTRVSVANKLPSCWSRRLDPAITLVAGSQYINQANAPRAIEALRADHFLTAKDRHTQAEPQGFQASTTEQLVLY